MNILKEGVRGAFVRIVRLITYGLIILLITYIVGLISSNKAHALTIKQTIGTTPTFSPNSRNGSLNSGSWVGLDFPLSSNLVLDTNYDYIGIQLNNSEFVYSENISLSGSVPTGYCDEYGYIDQVYVCPGGDCSSSVAFKEIICKHYTTPSGSSASLSGSINNQGDVYHYYALMTAPNGNLYPCHFSSDFEEVIFCPTKNNGNAITMTGLRFYISNKAYTSLNYYITLDNIKSYYNNDSTDIVNGLSAINTTQQQTNTYIQQQNTYITDTTTTASQNQATTSLSGISSTFDDALNGWGGEWSSLTHIILEPINVILYAFDSETTCSPIVLNVPYMTDKQITLPCMSSIYNTYFGTFMATFIMIMAGMYCYRTVIYVIRTLKEVLDAENDKIEVIDL